MPVAFDIEEGTVEKMAVEPSLSLISPSQPKLFFVKPNLTSSTSGDG